MTTTASPGPGPTITEAGPDGHVDRGPSLSRLLNQLERRVARRLEGLLSARHLSPDHWRVLDVLADGQPRTMSELTAPLSVPGPTMTKLVDRLVDAGLVYRAVDDADRRRVVVRLSDTGVQLHLDLCDRIRLVEEAVISDLGADAAVLVELLVRLERTTAVTPAS